MPVRQIMICAAARSGSTLLDMLLGQHGEVDSLGELDFLGKAIARDERCSCGELVKCCAAWRGVFNLVNEEKGIPLLERPYALRQWDTRMDNANADFNQQTRTYLFRRALRRAFTLAHFGGTVNACLVPLPPTLARGIDNALYLYDVIRRSRKVSVVVDSSKDIYKAISVYQRDPASTKIILLVRDGRGVMYSRLHSGVHTGESPRYAIQQWRKYYGRATTLLERWVGQEAHLTIRYEDLVSDPGAILTDIFAWIGVSEVPKDSIITDKVLHVAGGNDGTKARFGKGVALDERWRTGLSDGEMRLFERLAGPLNRLLGYS